MVYVSNMDEEVQQGKNAAQGPVAPGAGGGVHLAPSSGVAAGAAGGPKTGSAASTPGGNFATLNNYVAANQGQAAPLANQIVSGIGNQYNTLSQGNDTTANNIQSAVAAGSTPVSADALAQEAADPVSFASNPSNINSFQNALNGIYSGPSSAASDAGYQNQQAAINNAISAGNATTATEAGRQQLLTGVEQAPNQSVTALNSAILSKDPNSLSAVQNAYQPFQNLLTGLSTAGQNIDTSIANSKAGLATNQATANKAIADQTAALNTNLNNELAAAQTQYKNYGNAAADLGASLQKGVMPTGYGVDPGLQAFIDNNVTPFLSSIGIKGSPSYNFANAMGTIPTATAPTLANAASQGDVNTYNALMQLVAGTSAGANGLQGLNYAPTAAGTYSTPTIGNVNNQAIAGDIAAGLHSGNATQVNGAQFQQYNNLLAALGKYTNDPAYAHYGMVQVGHGIGQPTTWEYQSGFDPNSVPTIS